MGNSTEQLILKRLKQFGLKPQTFEIMLKYKEAMDNNELPVIISDKPLEFQSTFKNNKQSTINVFNSLSKGIVNKPFDFNPSGITITLSTYLLFKKRITKVKNGKYLKRAKKNQ